MTEPTGQVPSGAGQVPTTTVATNTTNAVDATLSTPGEGQVPDDEEEPYDKERALRTIRALRAEAKRATAAIKEADQLRAERQKAADEKLGDIERRDKRIQQLEAEMALGKQETQDRINHYEVQLHAARVGCVDPEAAVKLLDWSSLEYGDDGRPKDVEGALKQLLKDKPYLAGQAQGPQVSIGNGATRAPRPGEQTFTRSQIQDRTFYSAHREAIRQAMAEGRVVND